MNTHFSVKAQLYDTYRWNYPDEAISIIINKCNLNKDCIIADFGAGTGKLTHHFEHSVKKIYAIEPDDSMAMILKSRRIKNIHVIQKYAHDVSEIENDEVDVIVTGHTLHWFDFKKTIEVFRKVLKKSGYLVSINNSYMSGNSILNDMNKKLAVYVKNEVNGNKNMNTNRYFKEETIQKYEIPFLHIQSYEELLHGLSSASYYPDSSDGGTYEGFRRDVETVFEKYQKDGLVTYPCISTVLIGKLG